MRRAVELGLMTLRGVFEPSELLGIGDSPGVATSRFALARRGERRGAGAESGERRRPSDGVDSDGCSFERLWCSKGLASGKGNELPPSLSAASSRPAVVTAVRAVIGEEGWRAAQPCGTAVGDVEALLAVETPDAADSLLPLKRLSPRTRRQSPSPPATRVG